MYKYIIKKKKDDNISYIKYFLKWIIKLFIVWNKDLYNIFNIYFMMYIFNLKIYFIY